MLFKDAVIELYKKAKNLIVKFKENRNNKSVQRKALELLLPRLSVDEFFKIIDKEKKLSWDNGYSQAQYDIRKSLGL